MENLAYSRVNFITFINADGIHITIYPNPAHNYFVINHHGNIWDVSNASIVVRDMSGRMLIDQKFNNATEQKINTASLSKGLYTGESRY